MRQGDSRASLYLLLDGWACCYKQLEDGRRQVVSVSLPGDMCNRHAHLVASMDHSMCAITTATFAEIDPKSVEDVCADRPAVARALSISALADHSIQREWTLNLGQRTACERLGHFLCEIYVRQQALGLADAHGCPFPMTQTDLGETLGITSVHVNRTLKSLRKDGLIDIRRRRLLINDVRTLMRLSLFDPSYLHISHQADAGVPRTGGMAQTRNQA